MVSKTTDDFETYPIGGPVIVYIEQLRPGDPSIEGRRQMLGGTKGPNWFVAAAATDTDYGDTNFKAEVHIELHSGNASEIEAEISVLTEAARTDALVADVVRFSTRFTSEGAVLHVGNQEGTSEHATAIKMPAGRFGVLVTAEHRGSGGKAGEPTERLTFHLFPESVSRPDVVLKAESEFAKSLIDSSLPVFNPTGYLDQESAAYVDEPTGTGEYVYVLLAAAAYHEAGNVELRDGSLREAQQQGATAAELASWCEERQLWGQAAEYQRQLLAEIPSGNAEISDLVARRLDEYVSRSADPSSGVGL